jgi:diguanylate cyclase (GGDEF)-like protein
MSDGVPAPSQPLDAARPDGNQRRHDDGSTSLAPAVIAYGVGPLALVVLLGFRRFGLVAQAPMWLYAVTLIGSGVISRIAEKWRDSRPGSVRLHVRVVVHVVAVTSVIYLSGWGPALGMAYTFSALADMEQSGAKAWKAALAWSVTGCAIGQALVWQGWAPTLMTRSQAETIGALGAFVFAIAIRMAGAAGERKEHAEELLAHRALHDPLTGLPNRQLLVDRLTHVIAMARRRGGVPPVVMFLDLDRFKLVNDTFGHRAGDDLLVQVADRLRSVLRTTDTLSRFGGDEFVVLCEDLSTTQTVSMITERIQGVFDEPFEIAKERLSISVSIGVASLDDAVTTTEVLLSDADAAMYFAKAHGAAGKVQLFDHATRGAARNRVRTETALAHALERGELRLYYQPIIEIATTRIVGVEALLRWQHPERGLIGPAEFLELAERTGAIIPIGEWVLIEACTTVAGWNRQRPPDDQLGLSVNLSPRQLAETNLVDTIAQLIVSERIDPGELRLSFELTETFVAVNEERERSRLVQLHELGITLSVDDFGTGYSSLAYVKDLPVSVVKIDRSFVEGIERDPRHQAIVRGVIELAQSIDLHVVAEGVETEAQYRILADLGCDFAQGFLLGRPQPAEPERNRATMLESAPAARAHGASAQPSPAQSPSEPIASHV